MYLPWGEFSHFISCMLFVVCNSVLVDRLYCWQELAGMMVHVLLIVTVETSNSDSQGIIRNLCNPCYHMILRYFWVCGKWGIIAFYVINLQVHSFPPKWELFVCSVGRSTSCSWLGSSRDLWYCAHDMVENPRHCNIAGSHGERKRKATTLEKIDE